MSKKITAMFVFEIMGRPAEHIVNTLNQFIDKLAEVPVIKIKSRKVHDPKLIEKKDVKDIYSTFAEVELSAEDLEVIIDIVLQMLPAHVEIIEPTELRMQNFELSGVLSKLAIKIHKYDEIAKAALMERNILMQRLQEMQEKINKLEGQKASQSKGKKKIAKKPAKKKKVEKKKSKKAVKKK